MNPAAQTGVTSRRSLPSIWSTWEQAGREIFRRWRVGAIREPAQVDRRLAAIVALILCGAIIATAIIADVAVARAARDLSPGAVRIFAAITRIGESNWIFASTAIVALGALVLARGASRRTAAGLHVLAARATFIFATAAVSGILSQILKHLVGRARPKFLDLVGPFHFDLFSLNASYASFPSGHTITAFACGSALALFLPRWRWPLLALAALVGFSRLAVGAHYPSDVLAGAVIGAASTLYLSRAFTARRLVFRLGPTGAREPRGVGLIWPALVGLRGA